MESGRDGNYGYLEKVCLNTPETDIDLSDEKTFFRLYPEPQTGFDSEIKYYRWSVQADLTEKKPESGKFWKQAFHFSAERDILWNLSVNETDLWQILES